MRCVACVVLVVLLLSAMSQAQFGPDEPAAPKKPAVDPAANLAKAAYEANLAQHKGDPNFFIRPGILADKKAKTVRLWGKATGIGPNDPVEFFAIPADSGKDYESLSVVFTKASEVQEGLEFIGMKPGRPVDFSQNHYWPKGERVKMTFEWDEPPASGHGAGTPVKAPAEELVLDMHSNKPLPAVGFIFTGSSNADRLDAKAIAADYNEAASILDVPRQASKGAVYSTQQLNTGHRFMAGEPLQIVLEPLHKDLAPRVRDVKLSISIPPDAAPQAGQYLLSGSDGKKLTEGDSLVHVLAAFGRMTEAGEDVFVTLEPAESNTLSSLEQVYALFGQMDTENGIRIESPLPGDLYYRAFFPNPAWRDRTKRLGRPWELHLVVKDRKVAGTLILPADEIDDNGGKGDLKFTIATAQELAKTLDEKSDKFSKTVYIFAPPSMTYGELMGFIGPSMKTHQAYVFLPPKAPPQP
jgi:hypothetical protein